LPLEVVDWNNLAAEFYHLLVENPIFRVFLVFCIPNKPEGVDFGALFGVVGKPMPNFLYLCIKTISIYRVVFSKIDQKSVDTQSN